LNIFRNIFESNGDAYNKEDQIKIAGALKLFVHNKLIIKLKVIIKK